MSRGSVLRLLRRVFGVEIELDLGIDFGGSWRLEGHLDGCWQVVTVSEHIHSEFNG
jgi:hypothetical protein